MTHFDQTALVVLGAGLSTRFGSDKLGADLNGKPVAVHLLGAVQHLPFAERLLVGRSQDWTSSYRAAGFKILHNGAPSHGLSSSLRMGLAEVTSPQVMILLADMPFVSERHLVRLLAAFEANGRKPIASTSGRDRSPPALFLKADLDAYTLVGDSGARDLIRGGEAVEAPAAELADIDYPSQLPLPLVC